MKRAHKYPVDSLRSSIFLVLQKLTEHIPSIPTSLIPRIIFCSNCEFSVCKYCIFD